MSQSFRKFKAPDFDEAYRQMVRELGDDAIVLNTAEVRERGLLGLVGQKSVELTAASPPPPGIAPAAGERRKMSAVERKYAAHASPVGSDDNVNETIAYFRQLVSQAQARMGQPQAPRPRPVTEGNAAIAPQPAPEQHQQPATQADEVKRLQHDLHEVRDMLRVLVAEAPGNGVPREFSPYYQALLGCGVTREAAAELIAAVNRESDPRLLRDPRVVNERLKMEIRKRIAVSGGLVFTPGARKTVVLVGPTGVGKTTNLAKLAAQFAVKDHLRVALITVDTYRIAAPEQLRVYANIIGLPMRVANEPRELASAMYAFRDYDLVLIDTAGTSQFNTDKIQELKTTLTVAQPQEVMLVLSANTQVEELRNAVKSFQSLKPSSVLFSKLDETRQYGALFSLYTEAGLPLSYFSTGQDVPDDIELANAAKLAKLLVEGGENRG